MATYTTKQQKAVLDCLSERADSPVSAAAASTIVSNWPRAHRHRDGVPAA